jgi:sugar O-acyltransferase (sialic acid O-acetyltransferase NeuD family)
MKDIAIYGAGGFGREIACLLFKINEIEPQWNLIGFFDDSESIGKENEYGKILGNIDTLNLWNKPLSVVIAIGTPNSVKLLAKKIINSKVDFPNIIAPNVIFLDRKNIRMGKGNIICMNCFVSCNVILGDFNLFNGYIPIGHDAVFGNYNVVMPSVNISGGVKVGDCNFFGVQSVVLQYLKIGNDTRIGANSVIMRNTKDGNLYIGNPAVKIKL